MLPIMRKLTNLQLRKEVDYAEATRDISTILTMWKSGDTAGTRAFIPNIEHHDDCYNAIKIYHVQERS